MLDYATSPFLAKTFTSKVAHPPKCYLQLDRVQQLLLPPLLQKNNKDKSKPKSQKSPPASRSSSPNSSRNKKVEFGVAICISDLAKHYGIKSNLENCKPDCLYAHYNQLPPTLTTASVLNKVKRIIGKLNLTDGQSQLFLTKTEADSKFK